MGIIHTCIGIYVTTEYLHTRKMDIRKVAFSGTLSKYIA